MTTEKGKSEAFRRFEALTKRLLSVSKKEVEKTAQERGLDKNGKRHAK